MIIRNINVRRIFEKISQGKGALKRKNILIESHSWLYIGSKQNAFSCMYKQIIRNTQTFLSFLTCVNKAIDIL